MSNSSDPTISEESFVFADICLDAFSPLRMNALKMQNVHSGLENEATGRQMEWTRLEMLFRRKTMVSAMCVCVRWSKVQSNKRIDERSRTGVEHLEEGRAVDERICAIALPSWLGLCVRV